MRLSEYAQAWDDMERYIAALEAVCTEEQRMAAAEIVCPGCTSPEPRAIVQPELELVASCG